MALTLAACGGGPGGSNSLPPGGSGGGGSTQTQSEVAIGATNALGSPMKNFTSYNNAISVQSVGRSVASVQLGTCNNGVEFFAPDKNGDANSTETQDFYDQACTQIARDTVRIFQSTGSSSETVTRTVKIYAIGNSTASAVRTDVNTIVNASFDKYGFPMAASGFARSSVGELDLSGVKTIDSDNELVMLPASGGSNQFCSDAAGFNATGIQSLKETFGWAGGVLAGGTRTVNADGSVTWSATHAGNTYKGSIGSFSIAIGVQNTACPISKPMFTLAGGTQTGSYSIPITATYQAGMLVNLSIQNASLSNGTTLNVTTNAGVSPTSDLFITGTIGNDGVQVATFNVNAFGDGTLTMTSSGAQFVIIDWHVIR